MSIMDGHYVRQDPIIVWQCFLNTALCADPGDPVNGLTTLTGTSVGDTATYTCDEGFELVGSATATCAQIDANNAEFSPSDLPECLRKNF